LRARSDATSETPRGPWLFHVGLLARGDRCTDGRNG